MSTARTCAAILASSVLFAVAVPALQSVAAATPSPDSTGTASTRDDTVPRVAATLESRLAAVQAAKSINYYPSNAGWSTMWTGFDAARLDDDMAKAAELGADNIRVIVFPQAFGFPLPRPEYAERLRKFISTADAHGLSVRMTLFDWWSNYAEVADSATWATAVLAPYADDPRVLSVELKNEIPSADPDAVAWVRELIPALRQAVPQMPLTLSVDGDSGATGLARIRSSLVDTPLDYYDYHFYGNSERALAEIRRAQAAVSPAPLVIGETGLSTSLGSEGEQAAYLARVFRAAREAGVASVAPWTLYDFADGAIPSNAQVSKAPAQYKFGLYRADGSPKSSASVVRGAWTGEQLSESMLNLGFEATTSSSPWRPYQPEAGTAVLARDAARTGVFSARFAGTGRNGSSLPSICTSPVTPVGAGQTWHAVAWARGEAVTGTNEISLSWFDIDDRWLGQDISVPVAPGDSDWTRLSVDAVAPPGATSVQLHLKSGDNSGTVWFDDVELSVTGGVS